ncbi:MAG TPA: amidophosphoribosyltransferase [Methanocorpusculum sp.]|nr:amidophosphoribosyltransferase [Methanocorpusculum sp.]HJJ80505.1 amidophosphoribosyltransferase [Methanocorpusculum sp.]
MCGIAGTADTTPAAPVLYHLLHALQHRGQESAGIFVWDGTSVQKQKGYGLVSEVFSDADLKRFTGTVGIGHVRYPTTGGSKPENIQPFHLYAGRGVTFSSTSDTEVIGTVLAGELVKGKSPEDAVLFVLQKLSGSYAVICMLDGQLFGFRDPLGIKPFCMGKTKTGGYILASESAALDAVGAELLRDVRPREFVLVGTDGIVSSQLVKAESPAHCIFEYIYFARPDSILDGVPVYDVRRKTGEILARESSAAAEMVSPVPDSGTASAVGFAKQSGIPFREALIKNRYTGRTFILPSQEKRELGVRMKLNPVRSHVQNRSVILVDDSIVRGTTAKRILSLVRDFGAAEIHLRIASPPVIAPCYLGMDFPTREELISSAKTVDEVRDTIGASTLVHVSLSGLIEASGLPKESLCLGCLTGMYPLEIAGEVCEKKKMCVYRR